MIVLIGPSGCGKSTIEQELIKSGYKRTISFTTRPPRKGEKHGLNYYFISEDKFKENIQMGLVAEFSTYKGHLYGLPLSELSDDAVVVVEPIGFLKLKEKFSNVIGCYLDCEENIRRQRMLNRGDDIQAIDERILNDRHWFENIKEQTDIIIDTSNKTIDEIIDCIIKKEEKG